MHYYYHFAKITNQRQLILPVSFPMGCCISTSTESSPPSKSTNHISIPKTTTSKSPRPTHPIPELEIIVKEVPNPNPAISSFRENQFKKIPFTESIRVLPDFEEKHQNGTVPKKTQALDELCKDVSEICSTISENVSFSTEGAGKSKTDEFHEVQQTSQAKNAVKSTGQKPDPSPERVRPGSPIGGGRRPRMENGNSSEERSMYPVTRTDSGSSIPGLVPGQYWSKGGMSQGRMGSGLGERAQKQMVEKAKDGGVESKGPPTSNESLESSFVSLECFIFL